MPGSKNCSFRTIAVLALALGIVPGRVGLGQTSPLRRPCSEGCADPSKPADPDHA